MITRVFVWSLVCLICNPITVIAWQSENGTSLFDGESFEGWQGETDDTWRIEKGTIVAGSMDHVVPRNEFLTTNERFKDFELTLKFKIEGKKRLNCGVQFRTERIPNHHEVSGYQADIGKNVHGHLYDESRRRKFLASPSDEIQAQVLAAKPSDGWESYRIRAVGNRIQLWLNGIQTVDYLEEDDSIARNGVIALQVHGGMVGTIAYKDIQIKELNAKNETTIDDFAPIAGHWRGEAMGGTFEETWNPPMAGEMLGVFKMVNNDKISFYEILTIVPKDDSFVLRLKHFDSQLVGWEDKNKSVEFPFKAITENEIQFEGLVFKLKSDDEMLVEVVINRGEGEPQIVKFPYGRVVPAEGEIFKIIEMDALLSQVRNDATETQPISLAIKSYLAGLDAIDFSRSPREFSGAFKSHRDAWENSINFFSKYDDLRGEMHDVFDKIKSIDAEAKTGVEKHFNEIMSTWQDVEKSMGK